MENKKNIIAIIENIRAAKELSVEEKAQFDALTLQDWADLLNDGEKVTDLADKAAKNKTLQIKKEKCAEFLTMDREAMFTAFIDDPFYMTKRIVLDKKTSAYKVADVKKQLNFYDLNRAFQLKNSKELDANGNPILNKAVTIANDSKFDLYLRMFLDNIAQSIADDIKIVSPALTDLQAQKKAEYGMEGIGLAKMEEQLRKVCAAICPESVLPKMLKEDVKFIKISAANVKYDAIQVFNEKTMMNAIFSAIKTRKEGGKYKMTSKAACHRAKKEG